MPDGGARLLEELASAGVGPDEVDLVVHTHLHVDHVGWDGFFPNARSAVPTDEWSYFMSEESLAMRPHHFHGPGRFSRSDAGFSWSSLAEEGATAVE
jgi:glyoxylase-like metal-dependent hydrolase (beta-lactamase superfamily II)